jgi:hypothetical protein
MLPPSSRSLVIVCKDEDEARRFALDLDFGVPRLFIVRSVYHNSNPDWNLRHDFSLFVGDIEEWCEKPEEALARMAAIYTSSWCVVVAKGRITQALFESACEQAESTGEYRDANIYSAVRDHWFVNGFVQLADYLSGMTNAVSVTSAFSGEAVDDATVVELITDMYAMHDVYVHPSCGTPRINDPFISAMLQHVTKFTQLDDSPKTIFITNEVTREDIMTALDKLHPAGKLIIVATDKHQDMEGAERIFATKSRKKLFVVPASGHNRMAG